MAIDTFIFDMDGLLIDSEPLWEEAGYEVLRKFGIELTNEQYHSSTGLRTEEWIHHWFQHFSIPMQNAPDAVTNIIERATNKIREKGIAMPGVYQTLDLLKAHNYTLAIATSSPMSLVNVVTEQLEIKDYFEVLASAEKLPYGKPHPGVYMQCAESLGKKPVECACFEDSFNGMIAVKAALMKCVVVPAPQFQHELRWNAADLQLKSLLDFNENALEQFTARYRK